jgi:hypothetical protein
MSEDRIKALEREIELLTRIKELEEEISKLRLSQPAIVYIPSYPQPYPWQPLGPYYITSTTDVRNSISLT